MDRKFTLDALKTVQRIAEEVNTDDYRDVGTSHGSARCPEGFQLIEELIRNKPLSY